jgi:dTDP-4-amino-4,6-dideoxygalactose transaminase
VGTTGICGCFSFYPSKNLGAYGEGGAVVTNDLEIYQTIKALREHGGTKKYYYDQIGQNYRMHGMQGAILDVKLPYLEKWNEARRNNAALYWNALRVVEEIILPEEMDQANHVYHLYAIRTKKRDQLLRFLEENGIAAGIHYPIPCHLQNCYKTLNYSKGDFPIAEELSSQLISLPMYPELTSEQIDYIADKIIQFHNEPVRC